MHELGVVMEVVKTVERIARENSLTQIESVVLQIGELSSMIPQYIHACYPAAADGTLLEGAKLKIEILPANARCTQCGRVYRFMDNRICCPFCKSEGRELLSGKEFMIKEIIAC